MGAGAWVIAIDGHTAYVSNAIGVDVWNLARVGGTPELTFGADVDHFGLFRPMSIQDDRLAVVDDSGRASIIGLAGTTNGTPSVSIQANVNTGAVAMDDLGVFQNPFGDVELRGITQPLVNGADPGLFIIPYNPLTGALTIGGIQTRAGGFGAIAAVANQLLVSDGAIPTGQVNGAGQIAELFAVDATGLQLTQTQAVLAPFGLAVAGPVVLTVNADSGLETIILSR